jgi:hypothetical protein
LDLGENGGVEVVDEELKEDGSAVRKGVEFIHEVVDHLCKDIAVS